MKKLIIVAISCIAVTVQARLGQNQFSIEREYGKKLPVKVTELQSDYSLDISFSTAKLKIYLRGSQFLPMNSDINYRSSGTDIHLAEFKPLYKSHKSIKENVVFDAPIDKKHALKLLLKLLPKRSTKIKPDGPNKYQAKDFSKIINIEFEVINLTIKGKKVVLVKSITARYNEIQLKKISDKKKEQIEAEMLNKAKKAARAKKRNN